jgi:hypothetical protein
LAKNSEILSKIEVKWPFFSARAARSFAAERDEPELVLAIYAVS